jgi:hypothetical protein
MSGFIHTGSCPVCGGKRDKTGCRESRDGAYWCRTTFKSDRGRHKKGEVVNGYRFMHETEASGAYHIWRDPQDRGQKPRDKGPVRPAGCGLRVGHAAGPAHGLGSEGRALDHRLERHLQNRL